MRELPPLDIRTDIRDNQLYSNPNRLAQFNVLVQNVGSSEMPRFSVELLGPRTIKISPRVRPFGYLKRGKTRPALFKLRSREIGTNDLEVIVKRKDIIITRIPIKFHVVENIPTYQEPQGQIQQNISTNISVKTPEAVSLIKCSACGEKVEKNARFCPICGNDLSAKAAEPQQQNSINCPNCGITQPPEVRFCSECGWEIK